MVSCDWESSFVERVSEPGLLTILPDTRGDKTMQPGEPQQHQLIECNLTRAIRINHGYDLQCLFDNTNPENPGKMKNYSMCVISSFSHQQKYGATSPLFTFFHQRYIMEILSWKIVVNILSLPRLKS